METSALPLDGLERCAETKESGLGPLTAGPSAEGWGLRFGWAVSDSASRRVFKRKQETAVGPSERSQGLVSVAGLSQRAQHTADGHPLGIPRAPHSCVNYFKT